MTDAAAAILDTDRRRHRRYRCLESALVYFDGRVVDCQVKDISANGARLRPVGDISNESARCRILVARLGVFDAEVRWRAGDAAGVRFDAPPARVCERFAALLGAEAGA